MPVDRLRARGVRSTAQSIGEVCGSSGSRTSTTVPCGSARREGDRAAGRLDPDPPGRETEVPRAEPGLQVDLAHPYSVIGDDQPREVVGAAQLDSARSIRVDPAQVDPAQVDPHGARPGVLHHVGEQLTGRGQQQLVGLGRQQSAVVQHGRVSWLMVPRSSRLASPSAWSIRSADSWSPSIASSSSCGARTYCSAPSDFEPRPRLITISFRFARLRRELRPRSRARSWRSPDSPRGSSSRASSGWRETPDP